jgi:hypothetical protein
MKKVRLIMALCMLNPLLISTVSADTAISYLSVQSVEDREQTDCAERGGKRVIVINNHPEQIIDVHIDRYFSGVRQGGRSMFALASGAFQELGCDTVLDTEQSWKLISAEFIDNENALKRYGVIQSQQQ